MFQTHCFLGALVMWFQRNVMFSHNSSINVVFLFAALNSFWSELWALNHWGILVTNDPKHGFSTCGQQLYHWNFSGEWFVFKTGCIKFCYQWLLVYSLNFKLWNILWKSGNQCYMMHSFDSKYQPEKIFLN